MQNQNQWGQLDQLKLSWMVAETIKKLQFLDFISKEDDTSTELAEYEINKLLNRQASLEQEYDELIQVRSQLKGISNKHKLDEIQKEVQKVAGELRESTKKLGRLFRENPDLASDAMNIKEERITLTSKLEDLIGTLSGTSITPFQKDLIAELEDQDSLRKLIIEEKKLINLKKELHLKWKQLNQQY